MKIKTVEQVWSLIDQGKTVCCVNDAYQLTVEDTLIDWRKRNGYEIPFSNRDGKCLRVTCVSNWFGSLLLESELKNLYVKDVLK